MLILYFLCLIIFVLLISEMKWGGVFFGLLYLTTINFFMIIESWAYYPTILVFLIVNFILLIGTQIIAILGLFKIFSQDFISWLFLIFSALILADAFLIIILSIGLLMG